MQYFTFIFAMLKAIPIINDWVESFVIHYLEWRKAQIIEANKKIINEAIKNKDQRELESNQVSGKPSGHGHIIGELPRMREQGKD